MNAPAPTPDDVAEWMAAEVVYTNENGNYGIDKRVLSRFRALTVDVVWERGSRQWRIRESHDSEGRQAD